MGAYNWSMRHASLILFFISAVLFLIGLGQALVAVKNAAANTMIGGQPIAAGLGSFLIFIGGTFAALSSAAIPFIGAVAINRWDQR